jgi:hypothetical protein
MNSPGSRLCSATEVSWNLLGGSQAFALQVLSFEDSRTVAEIWGQVAITCLNKVHDQINSLDKVILGVIDLQILSSSCKKPWLKECLINSRGCLWLVNAFTRGSI